MTTQAGPATRGALDGRVAARRHDSVPTGASGATDLPGPRGGRSSGAARGRALDPVPWATALMLVTAGLWAMSGGVADLLSGGTGTHLALSRASGLAAALAALFGLVLTARPRWLERSAGLDHMIGWHRVTGMVAAFGMVVHVVAGLLAASGGSWGGMWRSFTDLVAGTEWFAAATAGAALFAIVSLTSWRRIRRSMPHETWHIVHVLGYLAVALGFPHQLFSGSTFVDAGFARWWWIALYAATAGIVVHSRIGGLVVSALRPRTVLARVIPEGPGVASLVITGPGVDTLGARPGQFVCLRILAPGLWWQAHPYSLSAAPQRGALRLTVKALGDCSAQTVALQPGARVLLEGPYGALSMDSTAGRPVLLVGAGVGVAPMRALLEACTAEQRPVVLARAHSDADVPLSAELDVLARERGGRLVRITGPRSSFPGGNPFTAEALARTIPDIRRRAVFVCGPAALQSRIAGELRRAGVPADRIHTERFAW